MDDPGGVGDVAGSGQVQACSAGAPPVYVSGSPSASAKQRAT